jgi:SAM-dependent methyltransferase
VKSRIIGSQSEWGDWLASPPGRYLIAWEQAEYDASVSDVFGYFALQCGTSWLQCLRSNRMTTRIRALLPGESETAAPACESPLSTIRIENFEEIPFASQSLDLVVLAHVLERSPDPHQVLREVDRVLRPEGRVMVTGFNPISLWTARRAVPAALMPPFMPGVVATLAAPRLCDWLKLLGFEPGRARYGCFRPPCRTQRWLDRTAFLEAAGDRWWPILGAAYFVCAVKRVHGMRLVGPAWKKSVPASGRAAVATTQRGAHRDGVSDTRIRATSAAD